MAAYMIALTLGFFLGASAVLIMAAMLVGKLNREEGTKREGNPERSDETATIKKEGMDLQWENFINYDGTQESQVELGGDD